ncbi:MAG: hypothetical protein ACR2RF_06060 [Geminicoccaceae bacterium]
MSGHTPAPWSWHESSWWGGYSGLYGPNGEDIVVPQTCNDGDTGAAWFEEITDEDRDLIAAAPETAAELERVREINAELVGALKRAERLIDEALPKFDWGKSFLDCNAIQLLNEVPGEVKSAIANATPRTATEDDSRDAVREIDGPDGWSDPDEGAR